VIWKTIDMPTGEEFELIFKQARLREQLQCPFLCKLYKSLDSSESTLCNKFYRITYLYEHTSYNLEEDLTSRLKLPNNNPDKVPQYLLVFQRKWAMVYLRKYTERIAGSQQHRHTPSRHPTCKYQSIRDWRNRSDRFPLTWRRIKFRIQKNGRRLRKV
jgi:hypothetical protein